MKGRVHVGERRLDQEPLLATQGQLRRDQNFRDRPSVAKYHDQKYTLFDLRPDHPLKRRIPETSVVNLVCTLKGFRGVTAAQFIWGLNLICFLVHFAFFMWTLSLILGWDGKDRQLHAPVFRIRANWTSPDVAGYNFDLVSNEQGFDIGAATAAWFGITAGFHFLALIAGLYERYWFYYWR